MKILLFTSVLYGGGAERVLTQLANCFSCDHEVILVAAYKGEEEYNINRSIKKVYIDTSVSERHSILQVMRLRRIISRERPDVCISFLPQPSFKMILASLGKKTRVVVSVRNDPKIEYANYMNRLFARILYPIAKGIVFQTHEAQSYFAMKLQNKSVVIMNQVDEKFFNIVRNSQDYWIATGRLNKQKNYPLLIYAFSELCKQYPNEILRIYGDGPEKENIYALITQLKMENNIFMMGSTSDVPKALSNAKGFVLTSDYEGMPNGLLEAMAAGVPCISTDCPCGGPRTVIKNHRNGVLIATNDGKALYRELCYLHHNPDVAAMLAQNAKSDAKSFRPEYVFEQWKDYIDSLM